MPAFLEIDMIEGLDYCFINPKDEKDTTHVRVLTGPYKDTLYKYGKVSFKEENDKAHLLFAFYVLESPMMKPKKLEQDPDFKQYAGDLLVDLMRSNLDEEMIDEIRANHTETPDLLGRLSP
jgi:hypothetical protein